MSKFKAIKKALNILDEVPTVEAQQALRESNPEKYREYLKALDREYGSKASRAKNEFGLDLKNLKKVHKDLDKKNKNVEFRVEPAQQTSLTPDNLPEGSYVVRGKAFTEDGDFIGLVDEDYFSPFSRSYSTSSVKNVDRISAYDRLTGEKIGSVPVEESLGFIKAKDDLPNLTSDPFNDWMVYVDPKYRGKGVASGMYREAERYKSTPMVPSSTQTSDGKAFWNEAGAGVEFSKEYYDVSKKLNDLKKVLLSEADRKFPDNPSKANSAYLDTINKNKTFKKLEQQVEDLSHKATKKINRPFGNIRHPEAAFDPRFKDSKNILAGVSAVPAMSTQDTMNPLKPLGKIMDAYDEGKDKLMDYLANQLDLTKDKSAKEDIKDITSMALDPLNVVNLPASLAVEGVRAMSEKKKKPQDN